MNVNLTATVVHRSTVKLSNALLLVNNVEKEQNALEFQVIVRSANAPKITLEIHFRNAEQNAMAMSTAQAINQRVSMVNILSYILIRAGCRASCFLFNN